MSKGERLARQVQRANPHAVVKHGKSHWVVMVDGKIAGILPRVPAKEGVSYNLRQQFARAGRDHPMITIWSVTGNHHVWWAAAALVMTVWQAWQKWPDEDEDEEYEDGYCELDDKYGYYLLDEDDIEEDTQDEEEQDDERY